MPDTHSRGVDHHFGNAPDFTSDLGLACWSCHRGVCDFHLVAMFFTGRTFQTAASKLNVPSYMVGCTLFLVNLWTTNVDLVSDFLPYAPTTTYILALM